MQLAFTFIMITSQISPFLWWSTVYVCSCSFVTNACWKILFLYLFCKQFAVSELKTKLWSCSKDSNVVVRWYRCNFILYNLRWSTDLFISFPSLKYSAPWFRKPLECRCRGARKVKYGIEWGMERGTKENRKRDGITKMRNTSRRYIPFHIFQRIWEFLIEFSKETKNLT